MWNLILRVSYQGEEEQLLKLDEKVFLRIAALFLTRTLGGSANTFSG
jgi:hypothetical protein